MEQHLMCPHTNYDDDDDVLKYLNFSEEDCAEPLALPPPPPPPPPGAAFPTTPDDDDGFDISLLDCVDDGDMQLWDDIIEGGDGDAPLMIEEPAPAAVVGGDQYGQPGKPPTLTLRPEQDDEASPVWGSAEHLDCSCCHLLRVVVHSDGQRSTKLALHGGLDVFYHAILDVYYDIEGLNMPAVEQSYIDLRGQNLEWVKQFLMNYGLLRSRERYLIMEDSLSTFYDTLCVSMSHQEEKPVNQAAAAAPAMPQPVGFCQSKRAEMDSSNLMARSGVRIAAQRERTKRLHLKDLAGYVHLPITEAAKKLQICPTALKKVCRKHGIHRWPYRKVRSLDREISSLQKELRSATPEETLNAQAKIEKLRAERSRVCAGLPP